VVGAEAVGEADGALCAGSLWMEPRYSASLQGGLADPTICEPGA